MQINNNVDTLPQVPKTRGENVGDLHGRPDKGMLDGSIAEPNPCSDPKHRRKQATGELLAHNKKLVKDKFTMTKMDATLERIWATCFEPCHQFLRRSM